MTKKMPQRQPQPKNNLLRISLIGVVILLFAVIALSFIRSKTEAPKIASRPGVAPVIAKAPANSIPTNAPLLKVPAKVLEMSFPVLDAQPQRLKDFAGKVVVIDIWATWCGPCRVEIPHLLELTKEYQRSEVEVIGLTTEDPGKDTDKVRDFVKEFKITYPIGFANGEFAAFLQQGRNVIPQTYVIGRDGQVHKRFVGFHPQNSPAELRNAVKEAVAVKN